MPRPEKPVARLGWLLDGELTFEPHRGPCRMAAEAHVALMGDLGRLENIDRALCDVLVLLGEALDGDPTSPSLWGQFRAALADLSQVGVKPDDALEQLIARLSADVPDASEPESKDTRPAGRARGAGTRATTDGAPTARR